MKRVASGVPALLLAFLVNNAANAQSSQTSFVCDPKAPTHCVKPNSDGSLNISGTISGGGTGGGDASAANQLLEIAAMQQLHQDNIAAISPVVTSSGATNNLVAKASGGIQYSVYATNLTATDAFLVGYDGATAPADGALTSANVKECVKLSAGQTVSINDQPGPGTMYAIGITYIITSATTCYTKTTGVVTAFIRAKVL